MSTRRTDDPAAIPANPFIAVARLGRLIWALENGKPMLARVLRDGHAHPAYHNLLIELGNLDYLLRTLPIPRGDDGRPLHPDEVKRDEGER